MKSKSWMDLYNHINSIQIPMPDTSKDTNQNTKLLKAKIVLELFDDDTATAKLDGSLVDLSTLIATLNKHSDSKAALLIAVSIVLEDMGYELVAGALEGIIQDALSENKDS